MAAPRFRMKVHRTGREVLVAASDEELVGREFREGDLKLHVHESFYGSEGTDEGTLVNHLRACTIANLVGVNVITVAVRHGFIDPDHIIEIGGIPHAQLATL
ncbi:MAG TPA: DUF424 family protein [Candidatus Thermoplasmatota archaeon]|nr:DUF424 family protein [Candidatus Thermoplasmatota archaeon]